MDYRRHHFYILPLTSFIIISPSECHLHPCFHVVLRSAEVVPLRVVLARPMEASKVQRRTAHKWKRMFAILSWKFFFPWQVLSRPTRQTDVRLKLTYLSWLNTFMFVVRKRFSSSFLNLRFRYNSTVDPKLTCYSFLSSNILSA